MPTIYGELIRLPIPPLSGERRQNLIQEVRRMAEDQKVAVRNARRDANKLIDTAKKDSTISEDQAEDARDEIQKLTKKFEGLIDELLAAKQKEIETI